MVIPRQGLGEDVGLPVAGAPTDGDVHVLAPEVHGVVRGEQRDLDLRVLRHEIEAVHQPARREDVETLMHSTVEAAGSPRRPQTLPSRISASCDIGQGGAVARELDLARQPPEQTGAEKVLELADLLAHGGGRDAQLVGRAAELRWRAAASKTRKRLSGQAGRLRRRCRPCLVRRAGDELFEPLISRCIHSVIPKLKVSSSCFYGLKNSLRALLDRLLPLLPILKPSFLSIGGSRYGTSA